MTAADQRRDVVATGDTSSRARIADILETIQALATLDFSRTAEVGPLGDDLDALAAGVNMLGEELQAAHDELEARVEERTRQLRELTQRLESENAERRRAESALGAQNAELSAAMRHLSKLNAEVIELTEMSNLFQVCTTKVEAFTVLGHVGPKLFANTKGLVFMFAPSRDVLELVTQWGDDEPATRTAAPEDCWGLRRSRPHRASRNGLWCDHNSPAWTGETLCVPLIAQGETLGLLQLHWDEHDRDGARYESLAVAAAEQIALAVANLELRATLELQSIKDSLTGLYNRRFLTESLTRELRRADRQGTPVSLLMIDVDHFKSFNDALGHGAGDAALRQIAETILESARDEDIVCRYGGEELAVVMSGLDQADSVRHAESIRERVAGTQLHWSKRPTGTVTISIGVATYPDTATSPESLMVAADAALYDAKRSGRNRVCSRPPA